MKRMKVGSSDSKENESRVIQNKKMNIGKNRKPLKTVISFEENELSSNDEDVNQIEGPKISHNCDLQKLVTKRVLLSVTTCMS